TTAGGVTPSGAQGSLDTIKTVATGTDTMTSGNLTLNLSLAPPNSAPTGTYNGTITFTTTTAGN
ncbi:MAG: hypothetical protein ACR2OU_15595, partial [Thermomicrobiales bacterium]